MQCNLKQVVANLSFLIFNLQVNYHSGPYTVVENSNFCLLTFCMHTRSMASVPYCDMCISSLLQALPHT